VKLGLGFVLVAHLDNVLLIQQMHHEMADSGLKLRLSVGINVILINPLLREISKATCPGHLMVNAAPNVFQVRRSQAV
jgi:hypothetical protein